MTMQQTIVSAYAPVESQSPEDARRELYDKQKTLLDTFLSHGAISQAQYDKSLHDLTVKMGYWIEINGEGNTNDYKSLRVKTSPVGT